jgi:hypothetical protein
MRLTKWVGCVLTLEKKLREERIELDRQIQERNETLRKMNEEKKKIEGEYRDEIKELKESIGMVKFKTNSVRKQIKNLSSQEVEKFFSEIEDYVQNSKTFMNQEKKIFGVEELMQMKQLIMKNEEENAKSLLQKENLNISNILKSYKSNQNNQKAQKKSKIKGITKYILNIRNKKNVPEKTVKGKEKNPKFIRNQEIKNKKKRKSENQKLKKEDSNKKKPNIKDLIDLEEVRNQKKEESKTAIKEIKNNLKMNYESRLESLQNNAKLTQEKIRKKISEVKIMYNKDKKKAEKETKRILNKSRAMHQICEQLRSVILLNLQGEKAKKRPWSMYRRSPTKKTGRPGSAVLWRQKVTFANSLSNKGKQIISSRSVSEMVQDSALSKWILRKLKGKVPQLESTISLLQEKKRIQNLQSLNDQTTNLKSDSTDVSRLESKFALTLTVDEKEILNKLEEKDSMTILDKENQVKSEIQKFNSSIYLMKLKEKKDSSVIDDIKPFMSKNVKSELKSWLHFEEKNQPELRKTLQSKDEFELQSIGKELLSIQKFLQMKISRPHTAKVTLRSGIVNPQDVPQIGKNKGGFRIFQKNHIGKIRPTTALPSHIRENRFDANAIKQRILSGQMDDCLNKLPSLNPQKKKFAQSMVNKRPKRITSAVPIRHSNNLLSSKTKNLRHNVKSSKGYTLKEIQQRGRTASIQEKCSRLTSGVLTRKTLIDQKLRQFNNRVLSGYYRKTFEDANSTKAESRAHSQNVNMKSVFHKKNNFCYESAIKKLETKAKMLNKLIR